MPIPRSRGIEHNCLRETFTDVLTRDISLSLLLLLVLFILLSLFLSELFLWPLENKPDAMLVDENGKTGEFKEEEEEVGGGCEDS